VQKDSVYLGFMVYREGLKMDPLKVRAIVDCLFPKMLLTLEFSMDCQVSMGSLFEILVAYVHH
jgi:hypothetical protein